VPFLSVNPLLLKASVVPTLADLVLVSIYFHPISIIHPSNEMRMENQSLILCVIIPKLSNSLVNLMEDEIRKEADAEDALIDPFESDIKDWEKIMKEYTEYID
jgi:hypothetical protein